MSKIFKEALNRVSKHSLYELRGAVTSITGLIIESCGPAVPLETQVKIKIRDEYIPGEVVGFKDNKILIMPYGYVNGLSVGTTVTAQETESIVEVSDKLLGRIVDPLGRPLDGKELSIHGDRVRLHREPPNPVTRTKVSKALDVGVRAINAFLTVGIGQRVAIMAGSGVGKSTLLGMIAKYSKSDINVIALVGERGREVREFIERDLGEEGLKRSIVVVATGDSSPLLRLRAGFLATAYAEYFRSKGKQVNLLLDSVTRLAMAQRELGLAIGEPPSTRGYTPSVFAMLPRLLERAGNDSGDGSITGFYTVLVEGDDMNEPIADAVRGILDGHIVLHRQLAAKGHFPSIEILESVSRVAKDILPDDAIKLSMIGREVISAYKNAEDLINIGAYKSGQDPKIDNAVARIEHLNNFLRQVPDEVETMEISWDKFKQVLTS